MNEKIVKTTITTIALLLFLSLIYYAYTHDVEEYVADSLLFMAGTILIHILYKKLDLDIISYSLFLLAMFSHNAGVFGWYNISPLPIQWDHITHIIGTLGPTLVLFRFCRRWMKGTPFTKIYTTLILILAALGAGVLIEYYEFIGYLTVGEGVGGLGQGEGDITTELGNSLWLNTMLDLVYNLVGALLGLLIGIALQYHKRE